MLRSGIAQAAELIREGELVAFPTETVYGLGADAFNANAVARVYREKGRPSDNPLILHISSMEQFAELADNPPTYAYELIKAFWQGPLALIVKKKPTLPAWIGGHPDNTTGTVGVRMPSHPVAQEFLREAGIIAAPSANKSGRPSPTTLAHVLEDFPEITALDGGSAEIGLESTVVDVTGDHPKILRHGAVTSEQINAIISIPTVENTDKSSIPRAPGMKYKHYAPHAEMTLVSGKRADVAAYILSECEKDSSQPVGVLLHKETDFPYPPTNAEVLILGGDPETIARNLFAHLRKFDRLGVDKIFAEAINESGIGMAIMDRMRKAAEGRIINV